LVPGSLVASGAYPQDHERAGSRRVTTWWFDFLSDAYPESPVLSGVYRIEGFAIVEALSCRLYDLRRYEKRMRDELAGGAC
jgi:hypothetical protein